MKILFLTIGRMNCIEDHAIYTDLLRCFRNNGHDVYIVSSREKRLGFPTEYLKEYGIHALRVKIGNITQCGLVEKGISTIRIEHQYRNAIKKYLGNVQFDLVLYSTPPITLCGVVKYIKYKDNAKTYLLLKDIFPQNAVDLGMMNQYGLKSVLYHYFRKREQQLYSISDRIGCMSQANVDYLLRHNPKIAPSVVEVCPNSIEVQNIIRTPACVAEIRKKYEIPRDKIVFVYGGNFGKPQGIPFIIECLKTQLTNNDVFFLLIGGGAEFGKLQRFFEEYQPDNMKLMSSIPKSNFDNLLIACDVGMIFLDYKFTIPNFPSRLLPYMQAAIPVFACTDANTDIGSVVVNGHFGWWCASDNPSGFSNMIQQIINEDLLERGRQARAYLEEFYTVQKSYETIYNSITKTGEGL